MPLKKLSPTDLSARGGGRRSANQEYVLFLVGLKLGEGGEATVEAEGASRQTIKNRLQRAAQDANVQLKFHRSGADSVVFEAVESATAKRRPGRPGRPRKVQA